MGYINTELILAHGFEPWVDKDMSGYYRRVTFKKSGLVGPVAEYFADDYIVISHCGVKSVQHLLQDVNGIADVVTQRFLMVDYADEGIRIKSFWLGFRGWLKIRGCTVTSDKECKSFGDLLHLALSNVK